MNARELQKRERIEGVKIIQVSIPRGQLRGIEEHARRHDGQQNSLNRFILRAITLAMQHDQDIDKVIDDGMSQHWKQEAHKWDGVPEEVREPGSLTFAEDTAKKYYKGG